MRFFKKNKKIVRFLRLTKAFFRHPIETVWINYKCLPVKQAWRLPIFVYTKTIFRSVSGKILIDSNVISTGMIKIGVDGWYPATAIPQTIWSINGLLKFTGPISFPQGTYILVAENAKLQFGTKGTFIGTNTKIMCFESITIGNSARITWDCQLYDTSFHYIDVGGKVTGLTSPISVGNNVWVGNNTTITKGAVIPDWTIIGNYSLVNKNLSENGEHCFYAGMPAILKKKNVTRIFDAEIENNYDNQFGYNRNHL